MKLGQQQLWLGLISITGALVLFVLLGIVAAG